MEPKISDYQILTNKTIYNGSIFDLHQNTIQLPNGNKALRDVIIHNGASVIVPVTDDGHIVLVRQHRPGTNTLMLELPAGKLDPNEDPQTCAIRELEEETGYKATKIKKLLDLHPVAAYCTEKVAMFLAEGLQKGEPKPDPDEFVEVEVYPLDEIFTMIDNGTITDMKTIAGVLYYARMSTQTDKGSKV